MEVLIVGDSFAAPSLSGAYGWPFLLALKHNVTNLAQPGVGEFKILQQLCSVDPEDYDCTIISHTSPYRIHTRYNPLHTDIRRNSDFMLNDVEHHYNNKVKHAEVIYKYISNYVDFDYQQEVWQLYVEKLIGLDNSLHFTFFSGIPTSLIANNFNHIFEKYSKSNAYSHLDEKGHDLTYQIIKNLIDKSLR